MNYFVLSLSLGINKSKKMKLNLIIVNEVKVERIRYENDPCNANFTNIYLGIESSDNQRQWKLGLPSIQCESTGKRQREKDKILKSIQVV